MPDIYTVPKPGDLLTPDDERGYMTHEKRLAFTVLHAAGFAMEDPANQVVRVRIQNRRTSYFSARRRHPYALVVALRIVPKYGDGNRGWASVKFEKTGVRTSDESDITLRIDLDRVRDAMSRVLAEGKARHERELRSMAAREDKAARYEQSSRLRDSLESELGYLRGLRLSGSDRAGDGVNVEIKDATADEVRAIYRVLREAGRKNPNYKK